MVGERQDMGEQPIHYGGMQQAERPVGRSILRGLLNTCPNCGSGKLFNAFLKPVDACAVCGEEMHHHRSDDLPPYLVIFVVGHVLLGGYMLTDMVFPLSMWVHMAIWLPMAILVSLASMQPVKGGVIGLQWALRMHGFSGTHDEDADPGRGGPAA